MKKLPVVFDRLAVRELDDATEYYELEVPGLGRRLRQEVKHAIGRIQRYPEAWPVERDDIKRYLLHNFPYRILYSIEEDHLLIIAIAHCHRRPDYWV